MTTAFTVDSLPLKWPFVGSRERVPSQIAPVRSRQTGQADHSVRHPAIDRVDVDAELGHLTDPTAFVSAQALASSAPSALSAGVVPMSGDAAIHANAQIISSYSIPMTRFGVSRRQMLGDVGLVLMWAAIIPGLLWFGHAAGF